MKVLLLLSMVCIACRAHALIGETRAQIERRLGRDPTAFNSDITYTKNGYTVSITFQGGRSVAESIAKAKPQKYVSPLDPAYEYQSPDPSGADFSDAEVNALLAVYGPGQAWEKSRIYESWTRGDNKVEARLTEGKRAYTEGQVSRPPAITFYDPDFIAAVGQEERDKAKRAKADAMNTATAQINDAFGVTPSATPAVAPTPPPVPPETFKQNVKYSQQAATQKYPDLARAGSPLNTRFLARLKSWQAAHDPRLDRSDWPERLADDCVAHP